MDFSIENIKFDFKDVYRLKKCKYILFVLVICTHFPCHVVSQFQRSPGDTFPIFQSLDAIMDVFKEERYRHPAIVDMILDVYHTKCVKPDVVVPVENRKPFIVLEGNDRLCREDVGLHLSKLLNCPLIMVPPKCLSNLTNFFEKGSLLRRAFFGLSVYAVSHKVKEYLSQNQTALVIGYWSDQASFILCRRHARPIDLPKIGDDIYKFPADLYPPDMVYYINYPFDANFNKWSTHSPIWKPKKIQIYHRFQGMSIMEIDASEGTEAAAEAILTNSKIYLHNYVQ